MLLVVSNNNQKHQKISNDSSDTSSNNNSYNISNINNNNHHTTIGPVSFTHDPRELLPSYTYLTHQQVISYISKVTAYTMLIQAEKGWPSPNLSHDLEKAAAFQPQAKFRHAVLPGSHHLRLDPLTAELTAQTVGGFLSDK